MKTPQEIIQILHSIKDVRLNANKEIEVKFNSPSSPFPDRWEPNAGYNPNSFTRELLALIQDALNGEVE